MFGLLSVHTPERRSEANLTPGVDSARSTEHIGRQLKPCYVMEKNVKYHRHTYVCYALEILRLKTVKTNQPETNKMFHCVTKIIFVCFVKNWL